MPAKHEKANKRQEDVALEGTQALSGNAPQELWTATPGQYLVVPNSAYETRFRRSPQIWFVTWITGARAGIVP
jgi:hypothetical protein